MQNIKIHRFEADRARPEKTAIFAITRMETAFTVMPSDIRELLVKNGIDLTAISGFSAKAVPKGILIEVRTGRDRLVIEVE
jgi:hypothetical protein